MSNNTTLGLIVLGAILMIGWRAFGIVGVVAGLAAIALLAGVVVWRASIMPAAGDAAAEHHRGEPP